LNRYLQGDLLAGKKQPVVLGIDPSLTGFAITALGADGSYESAMYKSHDRGVERLMDIAMWLRAKIDVLDLEGFPISDVAIEDSVVMSHSAVALGELHGIVRVSLFHSPVGKGKYPLRVPPTMVKKYATDKGNAKKNEVMLGVYKKWGVEFSDDNLADSYVLARVAAGYFKTAYEALVLEKLADPKFRDTQTLGSNS